MKNWYIAITEENQSELIEWWNDNVSKSVSYRPPRVGEYLMSKNPKDNSFYWSEIDTDRHGLNWQQEYELITLEQFRQITNSNKMKHPEHWYIVATEDNYDELEAWRQTVASSYLDYLESFRIGHPLLSEHPRDDSYYYGGSVDSLRCNSGYDGYQEITIEQFRAITNPLPEHWYIEVTEENIEELNRWRLSKRTIDAQRWDSRFVPGATLLSEHPEDDGSYFWLKDTTTPVEYKNPEYKPITLEQFRAITNSKPMSKTEVKTIQIPHSLLIEYYEAATTPQREYLTKHFKLDGTTTDEAIRGLYEMACSTWKPKIKANHPECFPEESKYFDFSEHTNQYGFDSIVSSHIAHSLGLCMNFIQVRSSTTKNNRRAFYLTDDYNWELVKEGGAMVLIPTKKVK